MMSLQNIALISLVLSNLIFVFLYYKTLVQLKETTETAVELFFTSHVMQETADENQQPEVEDVHKESFIKFLSDSRDWAFDYIEKTQSTISKFIQEVEPELEYYKKYGIVVEGMVPPHDKALQKITSEISELKNLLPEEIDDRR